MTTISILLIILAIGLILIYLLDTEKKLVIPFFFVFMLVIALSATIGNDLSKTSKKKIEPKIKVECMNNKCDTTYIYE